MPRPQVEDTLTHELVHAYDHCRYGQWLPFVGTQVRVRARGRDRVMVRVTTAAMASGCPSSAHR